MKEKLKEIISIKSILVTLLFGAVNALSCWLFVVPNNFANSGIEGIGVMVQYVTGFNVGYFQLIVNVPLCIFAYLCVNKRFAVDTALYTVFYTLFYKLYVFLQLEPFKYYTEGINTIYAVIITGILTGLSYGVLFLVSSSTGGVDIISKYINKRFPKYNFFYVTFAINAAIAITSCFVFAVKDGDVVKYSYAPLCMCLLCEFISNYIGDMIIKGTASAVKFFIVSDDVEQIEKDIFERLPRSSTRFDCTGSYTNNSKKALICVVKKSEILDLEAILKKYQDVFVFEEPVNKVIGYFSK